MFRRNLITFSIVGVSLLSCNIHESSAKEITSEAKHQSAIKLKDLLNQYESKLNIVKDNDFPIYYLKQLKTSKNMAEFNLKRSNMVGINESINNLETVYEEIDEAYSEVVLGEAPINISKLESTLIQADNLVSEEEQKYSTAEKQLLALMSRADEILYTLPSQSEIDVVTAELESAINVLKQERQRRVLEIKKEKVN